MTDMKHIAAVLFFFFQFTALSAQTLPAFPLWNDSLDQTRPTDWLLVPDSHPAEIYRSADGKDLVLYNGLVKRSFRVTPGVACTDYRNLINGQQLLRAVSPEARLVIDGQTYLVGGLAGQTERAYLLP